MSTEQHTPGPWRWIRTPSIHTLDNPRDAPDEIWDGKTWADGGESFDELRSAGGQTVLFGGWCNDGTADVVPMRAEDARLIASSPALLAALKALVDAVAFRREEWPEVAAARAAIAMAEPPAESFAERYGQALEQDVMPY